MVKFFVVLIVSSSCLTEADGYNMKREPTEENINNQENLSQFNLKTQPSLNNSRRRPIYSNRENLSRSTENAEIPGEKSEGRQNSDTCFKRFCNFLEKFCSCCIEDDNYSEDYSDDEYEKDKEVEQNNNYEELSVWNTRNSHFILGSDNQYRMISSHSGPLFDTKYPLVYGPYNEPLPRYPSIRIQNKGVLVIGNKCMKISKIQGSSILMCFPYRMQLDVFLKLINGDHSIAECDIQNRDSSINIQENISPESLANIPNNDNLDSEVGGENSNPIVRAINFISNLVTSGFNNYEDKDDHKINPKIHLSNVELNNLVENYAKNDKFYIKFICDSRLISFSDLNNLAISSTKDQVWSHVYRKPLKFNTNIHSDGPIDYNIASLFETIFFISKNKNNIKYREKWFAVSEEATQKQSKVQVKARLKVRFVGNSKCFEIDTFIDAPNKSDLYMLLKTELSLSDMEFFCFKEFPLPIFCCNGAFVRPSKYLCQCCYIPEKIQCCCIKKKKSCKLSPCGDCGIKVCMFCYMPAISGLNIIPTPESFMYKFFRCPWFC